MTTRRQILAVFASGALAPLAAFAQPQSKVWRIAILLAGRRVDTEMQSNAPFLAGLAELGYVEHRNLVVETRYGEGKLERLPELAKELIAWKPDLIFAPPAPATAAVKALTTTIPIVYCYVNEPVALGFAQSLAHPGGNLTGMSNFSVEIAGKRIEQLKEITPKMKRLCAWINPDAVNDTVELNAVEAAATRYGMQFQVLKARTPPEYDEAAAATRKWNADAIYINSNPAAFANRRQIIDLIAALKVPATYFNINFVEDGGLIAYAVDFQELARRSAVYADKIFRGAKPGDLPIEQPTKVNLAVNQKTAKALGIKIPQSILVRADKVIE